MSQSLGKTKTITIIKIDEAKNETEKDLLVVKMPLGRYEPFLRELSKIPKTISGIVKLLFGDGQEGMKDIKNGKEEQDRQKSEQPEDPFIDAILSLPLILADHWGDLISLVSMASGIDEEEISEIDADEAMQIIIAIIEINNFFGLKDRYQTLLLNYATVNQKQAGKAPMSIPGPKKKAK